MLISFKVVAILLATLLLVECQPQAGTTGALQKSIYQFLKSYSLTKTFADNLDRTSSLANDKTVINALDSGSNGMDSLNRTLPVDQTNLQNGFTVFAPINDAFSKLPAQQSNEILRNDLNNLVIKGRLGLDSFKNLTLTSSNTFGFQPRLSLRLMANFYANQQALNSQVVKRQDSESERVAIASNTSDTNLYEQYENTYGKKPSYDGPNISPKLPNDQLYFINGAIIMDRFELANGIVYIIDSMPQYFDSTIYDMVKNNIYNGLSSNINFWINKAEMANKAGYDNLINALKVYGPNTFFLPIDSTLQRFDQNLLNNNSYVVDVLLKSHRISNQIIFDYMLDDTTITHYTDTKLPVSTNHRFINGKHDIEISIGHVKGKIIPEFRNIYCASGIIHLIDTVLGVASETAYAKISKMNELSSFKSLIDRSSTYRTLLDTSPIVQNASGTPFKMMTILVPNDYALMAIKDDLLANQTALDLFLGTHIITDSSNKVFFTDHDESIFSNGRQFTSMSGYILNTIVKQSADGIGNDVTFQLQLNQAVKSTIINGNDLASNGVIHVVDKPLTLITPLDVTLLLEKYSNVNSPSSPAFNQFVEALRNTGIFNDLKQPDKQYTLFIPTNDALAKYQDILKGTDQDKIKQLLYRHICIDQNLQSQNLGSNTTSTTKDLICKNGLGQELTLTKDSYGLISKWQGMASSKVINDFPGQHSSAYLLDAPLLNTNLPNLGLHKFNSGNMISLNLLLNLASLFSLFYLFF